MATILVTGSSGFIGFHLCQKLLNLGHNVIGIDNLSEYYDVQLKIHRQSILTKLDNFKVINKCIESPGVVKDIFAIEKPNIVIHLAAQAGVRYSIDNPRTYLETNIVGTFEILEAARSHPPQHLMLASTSSVYGSNKDMPYKEYTQTDHQMSFYSATKKASESMAHSYSHLYGMPITMLRFFTVYGPWGRPDMALFKFTKAIFSGEPIDIYNYGNMKRDFTYITDIVDSISLLLGIAPEPPCKSEVLKKDSTSPVAPFRTVNIGNSFPIKLSEFIDALELATGKTAVKNLMPMQDGDVSDTWADTSILETLTGYAPKTDIQEGIKLFVEWYKKYYNIF